MTGHLELLILKVNESHDSYPAVLIIWATTWQNQQNGLCAQQRLRSVWVSARSDQSSLSTWRNLESLATHWSHSKDSDQTRQMPRLIRVFTGRTCYFVGFVMSLPIVGLFKIKLSKIFFLIWHNRFYACHKLSKQWKVRETDALWFNLCFILN